ncbi:TQO small subunit DoxD [Acidicapsa dinghuensis]|uniref:TQO small subunit DoxD n=1 Tax=Acidicapsa dinghuensis TaxID=2218256 RepID=A0ABW1EGC8_9BACT|nr:TQO small subunit DoxD [Acidicapsa dinghuensis]
MELLVGIILVTGFLTPIAAAVAAIRTLCIGLPLLSAQDATLHADEFALLYLTVLSVALVLLGPGAFSIDACLFGRREIIIPKSRPET